MLPTKVKEFIHKWLFPLLIGNSVVQLIMIFITPGIMDNGYRYGWIMMFFFFLFNSIILILLGREK